MTSRMQITLDDDTRREATRKAEKLGISIAEYVRRAIVADLGSKRTRKAKVEDLFDLGVSAEPTDVAREKGNMLANAIASPRRRK